MRITDEKKLKVAIIHDHLMQWGGAEAVLKVLRKAWPNAPIFTLLYDEDAMGAEFPKENIRTSFLQRAPFAKSKYRWYLPLMPAAIEHYNLSDFDVVISSSSAFAKGVVVPQDTLHICYCHTPTRYLWSDTHQYIDDLRSSSVIKKILPLILSKLRQWDQLAALRPDYFIANSRFIARRIEKYYHRSSTVIYPPVDIEAFSASHDAGEYYLTGGRMVSYKRFDISVRAFNQLGIPLKIFGEGPETEELKKIAKSNIEFLGKVDAEELKRLYRGCIAFIHPQVEDFGITPVEAMACGRPVVAFNGGGARETVVRGVTGEFFDEQTWECLADTIVRMDKGKFNPDTIREHAEKFSSEKFCHDIKRFVEDKYREMREKNNS